jgi:hypothetical protein
LKTTIKIFFVGFLLIRHTPGLSQVNLVQNPSFEVISPCPNGAYQINYTTYWDTLKNGGGGSPDLYNSCANPGIYGVPFNTAGFIENYQPARTGNGYVGLVASVPTQNVREYIQNKLSDTLISGKIYCVSFYVNVSYAAQYAINQFGAYVDDGSVGTIPFGIVTVTPQITNQVTNYLTDTLQWVKVSGNFVATGNEQYITIGNFFSNSQTDTITINPTTFNNSAYYFVDDVSLIPSDLPAFAGNDTSVCVADSIYLGRPDEIGLDNIWYVNNVPIDTGCGIWVKPITNTNYVVMQNLCGNISYDTVSITATCLGFKENVFSEKIEIYPNPSESEITIVNKSNKVISSVALLDFSERELKSKYFSKLEKSILPVEEVENGIYLLRIYSDENKMIGVYRVIINK